MAVMTGWPTDAGDGSVANEERWRKMARLFAPSGVAPGYLGELAPTLAAGPVINVATGAAWVDGHYCELLTSASESASADGLLVVRFTAATNLFELVYRAGATTPTQTEAVWELPIAKMSGGALTDLRRAAVDSGRLARVEAAASVASLDITNIPQTFTHLRLVASIRSNAIGVAARPCFIHLNADATTVYDHQTIRGTGATASAAHRGGDNGIRFAAPAATAWPTHFTPLTLDLPNYRVPGQRRGFLLTYGWTDTTGTTSASGNQVVETVFGTWRSTGPITSLKITGEGAGIDAGSVATLYGLA